MTAKTQPTQGIMFKFTYLENPKLDPNRVFDVVRFFEGTDGTRLKHNAMNHAQKTGAIAVASITPQQYEELLNEETKSTSSTSITA